jgi:hypothetical protein
MHCGASHLDGVDLWNIHSIRSVEVASTLRTPVTQDSRISARSRVVLLGAILSWLLSRRSSELDSLVR